MNPIHQRLNDLVDYLGDFAVRLTEEEQQMEAGDAKNNLISRRYNNYVQQLSENLRGSEDYGIGDLSPATPMAARHVIIAQENAKVADKGHPNGQSIRVSNLFNATIGSAFTLVARVIRVAFRTIFAPISLLVAAYQQHCYGPKMANAEKKYNIVAEDLKRIGYEWIDLGASLLVPFIGLINTLIPKAISTDWLRNYYITRTDDVREKNATFAAAKAAYKADQTTMHTNWQNAQQQ